MKISIQINDTNNSQSFLDIDKDNSIAFYAYDKDRLIKAIKAIKKINVKVLEKVLKEHF